MRSLDCGNDLRGTGWMGVMQRHRISPFIGSLKALPSSDILKLQNTHIADLATIRLFSTDSWFFSFKLGYGFKVPSFLVFCSLFNVFIGF